MTTRASIIAMALTFGATLGAQTPAPVTTPAQTGVTLTATAVNVKEPGTSVDIRLSRWSTDNERTSLADALLSPPAAPGNAGAGRAGAAGAAGRGGGRGRGDAGPPAGPFAAFVDALTKAPTIGYIWTNDVTGYAVKYAWREPAPEGGEHIVLATTRRLGGSSPSWVLTIPGTPTDYDFTVLDLHLDAKGVGEGRASLTTKVVANGETKTIGLENVAGTPPILRLRR